jgi:hypothetical protein
MKPVKTNLIQEQASGQLWLAPQKPGAQGDLLYMVTASEIRELREALREGGLPLDLETKLEKLSRGTLAERLTEQNCRLFITLLVAAQGGSFNEAAPAPREKLLRALAYVRKEDDAIPDFLPSGFTDDQLQVRIASTELYPLLQLFKCWRLRHQVPKLWDAEKHPGPQALHRPATRLDWQ